MEYPRPQVVPVVPGVELEEELGRGASSVVYRGRRKGEPCAVKVGRAGAREAAWFRREAAALARTPHPGLPAVLEVGTIGRTPYLIMELVEGETLAERLKRDAVGPEETLRVALELTAILSEVHRRGLVHRDIKPRNIILGAADRLRLVDFGLATFEHQPLDIGGTRAYAAPEQLRVPVVVDQRTDLYALGCVLHVCLTGELPPTVGAATVETGWWEVLDGLIRARPADRYPSAGAVHADLLRLQRGLPISGPSASLGWEDGPAIAGRDVELAVLEDGWRRVASPGHQGFRITGPSGSGKSRIAQELARVATQRGGCVLGIVGDPSDLRPLAGIRGLLDRIADAIRARSSDAPSETMLLHELGPELAGMAAGISGPLAEVLGIEKGAGAPKDTEVYAELLSEVVIRACGLLSPVLILVDDAQWIDSVSEAVLARLPDRAADLGLMLVLADRADSKDWGPSVTPLRLAPLSDEETRLLIDAHLGSPVNPAVSEWVARVGGETPLCTLEVLDAMVESGALVPFEGGWAFDRERTESIDLPRGARGLIARRLEALPVATTRVLSVAALFGMRFETEHVATLLEVTADDLGYAIAAARRAGLIEADGHRHRFVHDSVRAALLECLREGERRRLHNTIARMLEGSPQPDAHRVAFHYAEGDWSLDPDRALSALERAAESALDEFDTQTALTFFRTAQSIATAQQRSLSVGLLRAVGEAELRLGAHEESTQWLDRALEQTTDRNQRAQLLGRIAWAQQMKPDPDASWAALSRAFDELGETMPGATPRSAMITLAAWAGLRGRDPDPDRVELLVQLHYQNARLGLDYSRPATLVQGALIARKLAEESGDVAARARTLAVFGVLLAAVGRSAASKRHLTLARSLAAETGLPALVGYCEQAQGMRACFAGDFDEAEQVLTTMLAERGAWMGVHDFCLNVFNLRLIYALRGTESAASPWLARAQARIRSANRTPSAAAAIEASARATQAVLGGARGATPSRSASTAGHVRIATWGPRARCFVERADFGEGFAAVIREFNEEKTNPRTAHPILVEYYIAIAQARIHQCLRTSGVPRRHRLAQLDEAIADLQKIARLDLFKAHLRAAQGWQAWLHGSTKKARQRLGEAAHLADQESCLRVRYDVERAYAHILREEGKLTAARTHARTAARIAYEQGAVHWQRWILEELDVRPIVAAAVPRATTGGASSSLSTQRRQLAVLMRMLRTGRSESEPAEQARLVVDELIAMVGAARAVLAMEDNGSLSSGIVVGSDATRREWTVPAARVKELIGKARGAGIETRVTPWGSEEGRGVSLPLWLHEAVVGVFYLEWDSATADVSEADMDLLVALSYQIPVVLELARTLQERDRLQAVFRQAQKMEAVGRFAGGMAHDFNNMLTVMLGSLEVLRHEETLDREVQEELQIVYDAVGRAANLSRQLLTFSRTAQKGQAIDSYDLNQVLEGCRTLLERLTPSAIDIRYELDSEPAVTVVDRGVFEQAIVNLVQNAADAMPEGGSVTIRTEHVVLDEREAAQFLDLSVGKLVRVTVEDNGTGIPEAERQRIFDPFFTTKGEGKGTGLGLAMVYGFVKQHHGAIEVLSELGEGSRFRLYFPAELADAETHRRSSAPSAVEAMEPQAPTSTILVVEDEDGVRRVLSRVLSKTGYRVLSASHAKEALSIARDLGAELHLVITDILMPGMSGAELAAEIALSSPETKILFISGHSQSELGSLLPSSSSEHAFIQKPLDPSAVRTRVHEILTS